MARTTLALRQLPETNLTDLLDMSYFQIVDGKIRPIGSATLTAPVMSFGASSPTQNVINWTAPASATGYVLQVLIGATWTTIYTGALLTYTHTGLTASTSYDYRVRATAAGYGDSSYGLGSKSTIAAGEDPNLIAGYEFLDLSYLTGSPPLENTNNNWKITGDGFGQGQPARRLAVGGNIAFELQASSNNTKMCINWVAGSLGNYKAFEVEVNGIGVVRVIDSRDAIDEDLPTQPTIGQYVNLKRVSGTTSPAVFEVQIIGSDRTTLVYSKQYTVTGTPVADSAIEYDTTGGSAIVYKPQGSGLTTI